MNESIGLIFNKFRALQQTIENVISPSAEDLNFLFDTISVRTIPKDEYIIKAGKYCDFIGFVQTGSLRSYIVTDNNEVNNDFYFENDFLSAFTSFVTGQVTGWNIQALEEAVVYTIPKKTLETLYRQNPEWLALGKYIFEKEFIKKCKREASFLRDHAKTRYLTLLQLYPSIEERVPLFHIASYLGITPETLSRIRSGKMRN
jgi:CRP-like cAMP-binding protein